MHPGRNTSARHADTHANADTHADTNTNTHADTDTHADTNTNTNTHANTNTRANDISTFVHGVPDIRSRVAEHRPSVRLPFIRVMRGPVHRGY